MTAGVESATGASCIKQAVTVRVLMYMFFPGGGIGRYTHEVATELNQLPDIDLELACLREYQFLQEADYRTWPGLMRIASPLPLCRRARFLGAQFVSPQRAIRHAIQSNANILHLSNINHLTFPLWQRWLPRTNTLKVVATAHDVRRSKSILNRSWETHALRKFYESADAIFIHSSQQKDDLLDFANVREDSVHLVPMGTMPYAPATADKASLRQRFNIPRSRAVGLFFGNIRDDKNLDGLLTAISLQAEPMFLIIAGQAGGANNKNAAYYRQRIDALGLNEHVLFLDRFIANEEVGDLFEASDFVPICYLSSFTSQSAVLNVSMHYHRPVLVTPAPTLAETTQAFDIGAVTHSDTPDSLVMGIDALLCRIKEGPAFGFEEYKQHNSWQENARITRDVYRSLLLHPARVP